jgi:RNA:NAD 2'-phosphotransferase (TPT1/KptA family)
VSTLTLCHATHKRNLASIKKYGLLARKATRRRKAVWLASEASEDWAAKHCLANNICHLEDIIIITVEVPAEWLRGCRYDRLWYVPRDIPVSCLRRVKRVETVEESIS